MGWNHQPDIFGTKDSNPKLVTHHYWAGLWLPSTCGNEVSEDDLDSLTKEALLESKESLENMR